MDEKEFQEYLNNNMYNDDGSLKLYLRSFEGVNKYKSIRRAIKRGHVAMSGYIYPKRPFGNTKSKFNIIKRKIHERIKAHRQSI